MSGRVDVALRQARNPSEELRLRLEAAEHANAARWDQAEAAHRRALALAETEGHHGKMFKAHSDLGSLHQILGMRDAAVKEEFRRHYLKIFHLP